MATISFDNKTLTFTAVLSPDEAGLFARSGQSTTSLQAQFETWMAQIAAHVIERDRAAVRVKLDSATADQLQTMKATLGL